MVFLFLAWDEYFTFHEHIQHWERYYAALGLVLAVATAAAASRSPQTLRIWHYWLLGGLAMSGFGALAYSGPRQICGSLGRIAAGWMSLGLQLRRTPGVAGIWLALVAALGHYSSASPTPTVVARRALYAFPAIWLLYLVHGSFLPDIELRLWAAPASVEFESGVNLRGMRTDRNDRSYVLQLYATAERNDYIGKGYSINLLDQDSGVSVASQSRSTSRPAGLLFAPGHPFVHRQMVEVHLPATIPANRALWVVLKFWRERDGDFIPQKVIASDLRLLTDTQVVLEEFVLPAPASPATGSPLARFSSGFALESVDMPVAAAPGEDLPITFSWRSDAVGSDDRAQFLHLGHAETGEYFVYDQQPLGDRLPTRLWYAGMADSETWRVPLPADLAPGGYRVFTGLYRVSDGERVPVTDADGRPWLDNRVALGELLIQ